MTKKWEEAEERQIANLAKVKKERDNDRVRSTLKELRKAAKDESVNLIPYFLDCVKAYASIGEMCGVLRDVFGEWKPAGVM